MAEIYRGNKKLDINLLTTGMTQIGKWFYFGINPQGEPEETLIVTTHNDIVQDMPHVLVLREENIK